MDEDPQYDGLVSYFGSRVSHEDNAHRAVRAGLRVIETIHARNPQLERDYRGVALHVRIGIDTGTAVVEKIGEGQKGRATGIPSIVACRLQTIAKADTVVISGATSNLVRGYFIFEDLGLHHLPNLMNAVQAYRVVAESGIEHRLDAVGNRGL